MNKLLTSSALALVSFGAAAADLPGRSSAPAPVFAAASSWSGFYAGVTAGFTQMNSRVNDSDLNQFSGATFAHKPRGFIGGLAAGYNWQTGRFVYGLEADVSGSFAKKMTFEGTTDDAILTRLGALSTLRARFGFAVSDSALVYATAGLAAGFITNAAGDREGNNGDIPGRGWDDDDAVAAFGKWKLGWTVGAGAEYKLTSNWSARAEYLYADFGNSSATGEDDSARFRDKAHIGRVGLMYRFGATSAPAPAPVFVAASSWSGFYAGVTAGFTQMNSRVNDSDLNEFSGATFAHKPRGFIGGLAAGYNWQTGRFVYGLEADVSGSFAKKMTFEGTSDDAILTRLGALSTLRARFGFAVSDSALVYATAGLAAGFITNAAGDREGNNGDRPGSGWDDDDAVAAFGKWKLGWTVGAGAEYKLTSNWSARAEYLYADFGNSSATGESDSARFRDKAHIGRVGLMYRFGATSAPAVIARY